MSVYHVAIAIPIFFLLLVFEWYISKKKEKEVFNFRDSVLNISCGIIERGVNLLFFLFMYVFYYWLYNEYKIFSIDQSHFLTWISALVLLDFIYYWHHRLSHEINVLWGAHVAHHSSNEFNGTVAFRNSFFPLFLKMIWWMPLPILGFSPEIIFVVIVINGLYQFILHNRIIGKLGWLEYILVTPSSHRVHHGADEQYLDKNYGAFFIIWDRLFGTYEKEETEPTFGITTPLETQNPITVYVHHWVDLYRLSKQEKNWKKKLKIWFGRPSRVFAAYPEYYQKKKRSKPKAGNSSALIWYVAVQLLLAVGSVMIIYFWRDFFTVFQKWWIAAIFIFSGISISLLLENRPLYFRLEQLRLLLFAGIIGFLFHEYLVYWLVSLIFAALSISWIMWIQRGAKQKHKTLYNP